MCLYVVCRLVLWSLSVEDCRALIYHAKGVEFVKSSSNGCPQAKELEGVVTIHCFWGIYIAFCVPIIDELVVICCIC